MDIAINRLDPNVPDPVESRRRAAGRVVRMTYAAAVFGVLAFFIVYFGRPLVYLSGPGIVSSSRVIVSRPYAVQVGQMNVVSGSAVKAGDEIGRIWSPQQESVVATYMRALADVTAKSAELRIKVRVAQETLESARSYLRESEEAVQRVDTAGAATTSFRMEVFRERSLARKSVITLEAEASEAAAQLAQLDDFARQVREHLAEVERSFAGGKILAPITGVVSTKPAYIGQSLMAGSPIAEILDPSDVFVDWYVPSARLFDPQIGTEVFVLFGNRRLSGTITEILRVSDVYGGTQPSLAPERIATQIARIRFKRGTEPPPLNATVYVHMHYADFIARIAAGLVWLFGLGQP